VTDERWPELPDAWKDTYATLHMWTQVVGKIARAQAPPLNRPWGNALQITSRGLITRPLAPSAAFHQRDFGEFVLPYNAVRTAVDPDRVPRTFIDSTYTNAANLARWDRAALERTAG